MVEVGWLPALSGGRLSADLKLSALPDACFSVRIKTMQFEIFCFRCNKNRLIDHWKSLFKQESIPVGCIPPASVATTRCQYFGCTLQGRGCTFRRVYLPEGVYLPWEMCSHGVPSMYTHPPHPQEGTWDQAYPSHL